MEKLQNAQSFQPDISISTNSLEFALPERPADLAEKLHKEAALRIARVEELHRKKMAKLPEDCTFVPLTNERQKYLLEEEKRQAELLKIRNVQRAEQEKVKRRLDARKKLLPHDDHGAMEDRWKKRVKRSKLKRRLLPSGEKHSHAKVKKRHARVTASTIEAGQRLYRNGMEKTNIALSRHKKAVEDWAISELDLCSFSPKITPHDSHKRRYDKGGTAVSPGHRLYKLGQESLRKKNEMSNTVKIRDPNCTFSPKINRRPSAKGQSALAESKNVGERLYRSGKAKYKQKQQLHEKEAEMREGVTTFRPQLTPYKPSQPSKAERAGIAMSGSHRNRKSRFQSLYEQGQARLARQLKRESRQRFSFQPKLLGKDRRDKASEDGRKAKWITEAKQWNASCQIDTPQNWFNSFSKEAIEISEGFKEYAVRRPVRLPTTNQGHRLYSQGLRMLKNREHAHLTRVEELDSECTFIPLISRPSPQREEMVAEVRDRVITREGLVNEEIEAAVESMEEEEISRGCDAAAQTDVSLVMYRQMSSKIQALQRGIQARSTVKLHEKRQAARRIQKFERGRYVRRLLRNWIGAVTAMQALARKMLAQKEAEALRDVENGRTTETEVLKTRSNNAKRAKGAAKERPMPLAKAKDIIAAIYEKKVKADKVDDEAGKDRDSLPDFIDDFFKQQFGVPKIAKKKQNMLHAAVRSHHKKEKRLRWFGTFANWLDDDVHISEKSTHSIHTPYTAAAIDIYLDLLQAVLPVNAIEERMDDDPCLIQQRDLLSKVKEIFSDNDGVAEEIIQELRKAGEESTAKDGMIELDSSLDSIMLEWYAKESRFFAAWSASNDQETKEEAKDDLSDWNNCGTTESLSENKKQEDKEDKEKLEEKNGGGESAKSASKQQPQRQRKPVAKNIGIKKDPPARKPKKAKKTPAKPMPKKRAIMSKKKKKKTIAKPSAAKNSAKPPMKKK
eukprot:g4984.t1